MTDEKIEYEEVTREGGIRTLRVKKQPTDIEKGSPFTIDGKTYVKVADGDIHEYHTAKSKVLQDSLDKKDVADRLKALEKKEE